MLDKNLLEDWKLYQKSLFEQRMSHKSTCNMTYNGFQMLSCILSISVEPPKLELKRDRIHIIITPGELRGFNFVGTQLELTFRNEEPPIYLKFKSQAVLQYVIKNLEEFGSERVKLSTATSSS